MLGDEIMDDYIEYLIISGEFDSEDDSGNNKNKNNNDNNPGGCLTLVIVVVTVLWLIGKFLG